MTVPAAILEVRGLSKRYLGLTAVDNLSFEVEAGTVVGMIGPNGSAQRWGRFMVMMVVNPRMSANWISPTRRTL